MIDIANLWRYDLRKGNTDHPRNGACLMDAANWLVYGKIGDNPPCSCPIIRAYAIGLNDRMPTHRRQTLLKPFILRVVGNRDVAAEAARLRFIVVETARRVVPLMIEPYSPDKATALRALPDNADYGQVRAAATAAAARAAAAADADAVWIAATQILDGALRIGKQAPDFDEQAVRDSVAAFEAAQLISA